MILNLWGVEIIGPTTNTGGEPNISVRQVGWRRPDFNTAGKRSVFVAGSERLTAEQST